MSRPNLAALAAVVALPLVACGPAELDGTAEHRPDLVSIGGKADERPDWMRPVSETFGCGGSVVGTFRGRDSAHLFLFEPTPGRLARFEFVGSYPWHKGAAVAAYDAQSGELVELLRNQWDSRATLVFEPEPGRDLVVAVYSLTWEASGGYEVSARCPSSPVQ